MLSQIHLCLLLLGSAEILLTVDICLEELVSPGVKDEEGCSENSLCVFFFFSSLVVRVGKPIEKAQVFLIF